MGVRLAQGRQDIEGLCRIVWHVPPEPVRDRPFHMRCEVG